MKEQEQHTVPLVSIITINYNNSAVTAELLSSMKVINMTSVEVIVIDNASKEMEPLPLLKTFPWIRLIRSEQNLGFAGANNLA